MKRTTTVYEYDSDGKLMKKTVTEEEVQDNTPVYPATTWYGDPPAAKESGSAASSGNFVRIITY